MKTYDYETQQVTLTEDGRDDDIAMIMPREYWVALLGEYKKRGELTKALSTVLNEPVEYINGVLRMKSIQELRLEARAIVGAFR